jgi:hypothetical protein
MITAAILFEDGKPVRAWKDDRSIYNAYVWAHKHYCLEDEGLLLHRLPEWLEVKFYILTEESFNKLINGENNNE